MTLLSFMNPEWMLPRIDCRSRQDVVVRLVAALASGGRVIDQKALVADIQKREDEAATTIGGGIVLPHARSRHIEDLAVAVATLAHPIECETPDGRPVDIVILSASPAAGTRGLLRVLARLARLVKKGEFPSALRRAADPEAMMAVFAADLDAS